MSAPLSPLAGQTAPASALINVARLVTAYFAELPDVEQPAQRVAFGTSGHRGCAEDRSVNEWHVLAITQAICQVRHACGVDGPLFVGIDTHALSEPACASVLEVLAGNQVEVRLAPAGAFTPTPAVSHAILGHNRGRQRGLADGIILTPSHNPPRDGGLKYNPPHGGPAGSELTGRIGLLANRLIEQRLKGVRRVSHAAALRAASTRRHDFLDAYVRDLINVVDLDAVSDLKIRLGVDAMGGAGAAYWSAIAQRYRLDIDLMHEQADPRFAFMRLDWDGQIRMDPSSSYAMRGLIERRADYDIAVACDTDHDRHGIVTPETGLLPANHYLCVAIDYLFRHRPAWGAAAAIGKTAVSSGLIDRIATRLARRVIEVPPGFKWFSAGLADASIGFAGEESAGASFLRRDGTPWTTDKDGIAAALLAAEITARCGRDPGMLYGELTEALGEPVARRIEGHAEPLLKQRLASLSAADLGLRELAGDPVEAAWDHLPGGGAALGGIKVRTRRGWFAARPSGTEDLYKIYAESFAGAEHLDALIAEAQTIVDRVMAAPASPAPAPISPATSTAAIASAARQRPDARPGTESR